MTAHDRSPYASRSMVDFSEWQLTPAAVSVCVVCSRLLTYSLLYWDLLMSCLRLHVLIGNTHTSWSDLQIDVVPTPDRKGHGLMVEALLASHKLYSIWQQCSEWRIQICWKMQSHTQNVALCLVGNHTIVWVKVGGSRTFGGGAISPSAFNSYWALARKNNYCY